MRSIPLHHRQVHAVEAAAPTVPTQPNSAFALPWDVVPCVGEGLVVPDGSFPFPMSFTALRGFSQYAIYVEVSWRRCC